ncbi:hypothetical protein ANN_14410 [Periplaneta americana]|uniref:Uncharacterized protein n=1 Tax=Periplaneta americana TaxID=6978 RepID=A0ABQ8SYD6_PERAM|nr:hypothetical protein ANN_14410 [Periplaneta americana]
MDTALLSRWLLELADSVIPDVGYRYLEAYESTCNSTFYAIRIRSLQNMAYNRFSLDRSENIRQEKTFHTYNYFLQLQVLAAFEWHLWRTNSQLVFAFPHTVELLWSYCRNNDDMSINKTFDTGHQLTLMKWMRNHYTMSVTVWCAIASFGIIGPYFFVDDNGTSVTVTLQRYIRMNEKFLSPQITNNPLINRAT